MSTSLTHDRPGRPGRPGRPVAPPAPRALRFPWPFTGPEYSYSANVEPARGTRSTPAGAWGGSVVDVGPDYLEELAVRAEVLERDPSRCAVLPHMLPATWDAALHLMRELAGTHPDDFSLEELDDGSWRWRNALLGCEQVFALGDPSTLPEPPLPFIGGQVQEDVVLLDQREGALWADAALVTCAADWSVNFDVGMSFAQVHGPVPRVHEAGVVARAEQFLMRLQPGESYRRTNWTMTVDRRLDSATETYPEWGPDRLLSADEVGHRLHLRVEVQHLIRLPLTGCVLFLIRTHLLSLEEVATVPVWARQLASVLRALPDDVADYKGLTRYREKAVLWLERHS